MAAKIVYGRARLPASGASPKRLLGLVRQHWGIENGLHYRRDKTLHGDAPISRPNSTQNMATLNNLIVGPALTHGWQSLSAARRY